MSQTKASAKITPKAGPRKSSAAAPEKSSKTAPKARSKINTESASEAKPRPVSKKRSEAKLGKTVMRGETIEWVVPADAKGTRLDAALAARHADTSRSLLQEMIKKGDVTVDGSATKSSSKLKGGETVCYSIPKAPASEPISATPLDFPILFEDDALVVIDKPVGLVVHPGAGHEKVSVVSCLLSHTGLSPIGAPIRPGVVHRLDKSTSGVMILAKSEIAHRRLTKLFAGRTVHKEYLALVNGEIGADKGRVEVAIERDRVQRKRMMATHPDRGKSAVSHYEVVERFPGATLVRVSIETGRTHQIRVHLAYIGHPLLGDILYGGRKFRGDPKHFLHSFRLQIPHPMTKKEISCEAPLPAAFQEAIQFLRLSGLKPGSRR